MTRDLSFIGMGSKASYDAWPHTRAQLANLRDMALNDEELDRVARIADAFDAEDRAWMEAGRVLRRIRDGGNRGGLSVRPLGK